MKKLLSVFFLLPFVTASAQSGFQDSLATERVALIKNNLWVLGAWAGANIVQGSISAGNTAGSGQYLHRMNVYWNTVNLAIAGIGLLAIKKQLAGPHSFERNVKEQQKLEKLLILNTGLDAAYIMTGMYLKEKGLRQNSDQSVGFGNSLLLQGSFLLVFDMIQYFQHRRNSKALEQHKAGWELGSTGNGVGLAYRF